MEEDFSSAECLSDNERFADLINGFVFHGRQVVNAKDLTDLDSRTGVRGSKAYRQRGGRRLRSKYRDLIRKAAFGINFVAIGIENQTEVHYLMPLRTMSYDAGEYERQAKHFKKKIRKKKGISRSEFLSGFERKSRLHPCITFVLYYGKAWDGSTDLYGILDFEDIPEELRKYINNYKINLLEIRKLTDTGVFRTDLKQIFDFIRYADDKNKLMELVRNDPAYQEMEEDAFEMAAAYSKSEELMNIGKFHEKKGGKRNMCKALEDLIADSKAEGIEKGREEGREEGKEEGMKAMICAMREEGIENTKIAKSISKYFRLSLDKAEEYVEKMQE